MTPDGRYLQITDTLVLPISELEMKATTSGGPGGQHVNRVATAVELRLNIPASSLPESLKSRLLKRADQRLTQAGELVISASNHRSQKRNRADALDRLQQYLQEAATPPKPRRKTRPSRAVKERRLKDKKHRGERKRLRGKTWNE